MDDDSDTRLRFDYERVALAGIKRIRVSSHGDGHDETDQSVVDALSRLTGANLASREGPTIILQRPEHDALPLLHALYEYWLRADADDTLPVDEVLWGEPGFWQHWWNMLHDRGAADPVPLRMDAIVDTSFGERPWLAELDASLLERVTDLGVLSGRVIVPPSTLDNLAEGIVEHASRIGFEIRVLPSISPFVIYNGAAVVLPECDSGGLQGYRLTRRASVVNPLQTLFDMRWASATPWED